MKNKLHDFFFGRYTTKRTRLLYLIVRLYELLLIYGIIYTSFTIIKCVIIKEQVEIIESLFSVVLAIGVVVIIEALLE